MSTSLKIIFFKKICETGAMPLFHACGAASMDCAFFSSSFSLSISLYFSFFLQVRIVDLVRYETILNRTVGRSKRLTAPVQHTLVLTNKGKWGAYVYVYLRLIIDMTIVIVIVSLKEMV